MCAHSYVSGKLCVRVCVSRVRYEWRHTAKQATHSFHIVLAGLGCRLALLCGAAAPGAPRLRSRRIAPSAACLIASLLALLASSAPATERSRNVGDLYGDLPGIKARCSEIIRYTRETPRTFLKLR